MDKRYLLIIGIIVICCVNLYAITTFSDVVGSAYFDVGNYTFTLPEGFTVENTENNHVVIINQNSKMKIHIFSYLSKTDTYKNAYNFVENNSGCTMISNGTIHHNNIAIDSIYYVQNGRNSSVFYFNKENNGFKIVLTDFNQKTQHNETINIITELVDSERINHRL